jgi:hypothetical protein
MSNAASDGLIRSQVEALLPGYRLIAGRHQSNHRCPSGTKNPTENVPVFPHEPSIMPSNHSRSSSR